MMIIRRICCYFLCLNFYLWVNGQSTKINYKIIKTKSYTPKHYFGEVLFEMDYASDVIKNPEEWSVENKVEIKKVNIIFSDYPKNRSDWLTNYDTLLNRRIKSLKTIIPWIDSNPKTKWNIILQTDCQTEQEAQQLFHGIVVLYKKKVPLHVVEAYKIITQTIDGSIKLEDSSIYNIFERNKQWQNMLIINDWTSSMYPYGTQLILWHKLNLTTPHIKYFVFFNDGNQKKDRHKKIGQTGGFFFTGADNFKSIYRAIRHTMMNGLGGDIPENDVEAILYGLEKSKYKVDDVILIADNRSNIRDKVLSHKITKPIKIIVCGRKNLLVHSDYLDLAYATGGSVHTIEQDIQNLAKLSEGSIIKIGRYRYKLEDGKFHLIR